MRCSSGPSCREALRKGWKMRFIFKMLGAQAQRHFTTNSKQEDLLPPSTAESAERDIRKSRRSRRGQRLVASLGRALAVLPRHILDSQQDERRPRLQFNPAGV